MVAVVGSSARLVLCFRRTMPALNLFAESELPDSLSTYNLCVYQLDWADYFKVTVEVDLQEKMSGKTASSLAAGLVQAGAEAVTVSIE
jgi:hypothetical protein